MYCIIYLQYTTDINTINKQWIIIMKINKHIDLPDSDLKQQRHDCTRGCSLLHHSYTTL